jgi:hypothetical protein
MNEYYTEEEGIYPDILNTTSTETHLYGFCWEAIFANNKYIFNYTSGEVAGRSKSFEISEQDFNALKEKKITDADLLRQYDQY